MGARAARAWPRTLVVVAAVTVLLLPGARAAASDLLVVAFTVNGVDHGSAVVTMVSEGDRRVDFWVPADDLERVGLRSARDGALRVIDDKVHVSLASLAPLVRFRYDEQLIAVHLTVAPQLLPRAVVDLAPHTRPRDVVYARDTTAVVSYGVSAASDQRVGATLEGAVNVRGDLLLRSTLTADTTHGPVRGLTSAIHDRRDSLTRWTLGDAIATPPDTLGGSLFVGGVSVAKRYELDPYLSRHGPVGITGVAALPSTAEVYVDGRLVRTERLPPGEFELRNLPVTAGSRTTRVVLRDALGREQELSSSIYHSVRVLVPGFHEYGYHVGLRREGVGTHNFDYRWPACLAWHRVGLAPWLTLGGRVEAGEDVLSGGTQAAVRLPVGDLELGVASSHADGDAGAAATLAFSRIGPREGLSIGITARSDRYATSSLSPAQDRPRLEASSHVGFPIARRASLTLSSQAGARRDGALASRVGLTGHFALASRLALTVSGGVGMDGGRPHGDVGASLVLWLGERAHASVSSDVSKAGVAASAHVQRALPPGPGVGYRLDASAGARPSVGAGADLQNRHGRLHTAVRWDGDGVRADALVSGSVAVAGSGVYVARSAGDAFAVVRLPVPGVRTYYNHNEIGRTGADGTIFVPNLQPYYGNKLSIATEDIPLEYEVVEDRRLVAPPYGGGAVVSLRIRPVRDVTGTVDVAGHEGAATVQGATLTLRHDGRTVSSPIGTDGSFYLEGVDRGRYTATLEYAGGTCSLTVEVPRTRALVTDLGKLRCVPTEGAR